MKSKIFAYLVHYCFLDPNSSFLPSTFSYLKKNDLEKEKEETTKGEEGSRGRMQQSKSRGERGGEGGGGPEGEGRRERKEEHN